MPEIIMALLIIEPDFYIWMKKNNRLGGQSKIPRLSNDRKIVNEILKT